MHSEKNIKILQEISCWKNNIWPWDVSFYSNLLTLSSAASKRTQFSLLLRQISYAVSPIPFFSLVSISLFIRNSSRVFRLSGSAEARWRAVCPPCVWALIHAPRCNKREATSTWFQRAALWRGRHPSSVSALISAPWLSNNLENNTDM